MNIYNSNIDFNKYKVFYAVAFNKSFSKAAEELHISQPAISYSIKELESQLNTKLFIRKNKEICLTESGEKLLSYVSNAFNYMLKAEKEIKEEKKELSGSIKIGIYSHICLFMLPTFLKEFREKYPDASIEIYSTSTDETKSKLLKKELDFAVLQYPIFENNNDYEEDILCSLENCFYSGKKYYDLYNSNSSNISEYPLLLPVKECSDMYYLELLFKKNNMSLNNNYRVYTTELNKKLAMNDIGISWGLKKSIEDEVKNKKLYIINTEFESPKTTFSISYNKKYLNNISKIFLDEFKKYIKDNL